MNKKIFIELIGMSAGALTTLAFLPQVIHIWQTKITAGVTLSTYIMLEIGVILWIIYGVLKKSLSVLIANVCTLLLVSTVIILKLTLS